MKLSVDVVLDSQLIMASQENNGEQRIRQFNVAIAAWLKRKAGRAQMREEWNVLDKDITSNDLLKVAISLEEYP